MNVFPTSYFGDFPSDFSGIIRVPFTTEDDLLTGSGGVYLIKDIFTSSTSSVIAIPVSSYVHTAAAISHTTSAVGLTLASAPFTGGARWDDLAPCDAACIVDPNQDGISDILYLEVPAATFSIPSDATLVGIKLILNGCYIDMHGNPFEDVAVQVTLSVNSTAHGSGIIPAVTDSSQNLTLGSLTSNAWGYTPTYTQFNGKWGIAISFQSASWLATLHPDTNCATIQVAYTTPDPIPDQFGKLMNVASVNFTAVRLVGGSDYIEAGHEYSLYLYNGSIGSSPSFSVIGSFSIENRADTLITSGVKARIGGAIWDAKRNSYATSGSFGQAVTAVNGSVGSVTNPVVVGTNNDKANYSLSTAGSGAIWDTQRSTHLTPGSFGELAQGVYHADILFTRDQTNSNDEYTVLWYRNGIPLTSGVASPTIAAVKRANGTDLISVKNMTQIGATAMFKYDATGTERQSLGEASIVTVTAVIDSALRTFSRIVGRDN